MLTPIPVVYDEMHFIKLNGFFIQRYHVIAKLNASTVSKPVVVLKKTRALPVLWLADVPLLPN